MKKTLIILTTVGIAALSGCASNSASQKGLKKSPCACVYQSLPSAEYQLSDPFAKTLKTNLVEGTKA
ncbi:hypothetical protein [Acinetobacter sp. Leaf130]|uniref:hypothetical protein n=1 Tax=Acinetobacter sp. Leaf130 TaxID=1736269 RepID=UPI0006F884C8|nr:hypothetical protein [Acinetobacter sp. Leaf130]KQQ65478.1 hypothetical protein ASF86_18535 [Acinetobacter sp. Leaf130]